MTEYLKSHINLIVAQTHITPFGKNNITSFVSYVTHITPISAMTTNAYYMKYMQIILF